MVWTCYTSNRTCKHHHAGHSTRREETRQTKKMLARQHQGMDGAASRQDPETSRRQRQLEKDHQNIFGAPTAPQRLRAADADEYMPFILASLTQCLRPLFSSQSILPHSLPLLLHPSSSRQQAGQPVTVQSEDDHGLCLGAHCFDYTELRPHKLSRYVSLTRNVLLNRSNQRRL